MLFNVWLPNCRKYYTFLKICFFFFKMFLSQLEAFISLIRMQNGELLFLMKSKSFISNSDCLIPLKFLRKSSPRVNIKRSNMPANIEVYFEPWLQFSSTLSMQRSSSSSHGTAQIHFCVYRCLQANVAFVNLSGGYPMVLGHWLHIFSSSSDPSGQCSYPSHTMSLCIQVELFAQKNIPFSLHLLLLICESNDLFSWYVKISSDLSLQLKKLSSDLHCPGQLPLHLPKSHVLFLQNVSLLQSFLLFSVSNSLGNTLGQSSFLE